MSTDLYTVALADSGCGQGLEVLNLRDAVTLALHAQDGFTLLFSAVAVIFGRRSCALKLLESGADANRANLVVR